MSLISPPMSPRTQADCIHAYCAQHEKVKALKEDFIQATLKTMDISLTIGVTV